VDSRGIGLERLILKNKQLRLYFVSNPDSPYFVSETFKYILQVIQQQIKNARLKNVGTNFMLIIDPIKTIDEVLNLLQRMQKPATQPAIDRSCFKIFKQAVFRTTFSTYY
jgi:transcription-repair coupling factor (superfamily II helicase)